MLFGCSVARHRSVSIRHFHPARCFLSSGKAWASAWESHDEQSTRVLFVHQIISIIFTNWVNVTKDVSADGESLRRGGSMCRPPAAQRASRREPVKTLTSQLLKITYLSTRAWPLGSDLRVCRICWCFKCLTVCFSGVHLHLNTFPSLWMMLKCCFCPLVPLWDTLTMHVAVMFCTVLRSHITPSGVYYCKKK